MRQDFTGVDGHAYYGTPTRSGGGDQYELSGTFGHRRPGEGSLQRVPLGQLPGAEVARPARPRVLEDELPAGHRAQHDVGPDASPASSRRAASATRASRIAPARLDRRSAAAAASTPPRPGVAVDARTRSSSTCSARARFQINADWQAYCDRALLAPGNERRDPAAADLRPDPDDRHADRRCRHPAAADQPVLSARPGRAPPASTASRSTCAIAASSAAIAQWTDKNEAWQAVAGCARARRGTGTSTARSTTARTQSKETPDGRHSAVLAHPAAAEQRGGEPVRAEHAGHHAAGAGHRLHRGGLPRQAVRLRLRPQGLGRNRTSCPPARWRWRSARSAFKENLTQNPTPAAADRRRRRTTAATSRTSTTRARCRRCSASSTSRSCKTLEANVAVRYDHYSDFGSTTNPKVSLRWQPMRQLLVRGSWGTGFLAPTLYQLWNPRDAGPVAGGPVAIRCAARTRTIPRAPTTRTATRNTR